MSVRSRLLVALAFATWCFLDVWTNLVQRDPYFARYDPVQVPGIPLLCWEVVIAAAMFGAWELCRARDLGRFQLTHWAFLGSCTVPLLVVRGAVAQMVPAALTPLVRARGLQLGLLAASLALAALCVVRARLASQRIRQVFLYSWPVLLLICANAAFRLQPFRPAAYADGPLALRLAGPSHRPRVVWIIFDELSRTIAFDQRPDGLRLPNFDRLKAGSFYARSAVAPADSTTVSMPALITGEMVDQAQSDGPAQCWLKIASQGRRIAWGSVPNVFDAARQMGFNTALVGWFHPYGRLLNRSLTECYWTPAQGLKQPFASRSLVPAMADLAGWQLATLLAYAPGADAGRHEREQTVQHLAYLLDHTRRIVADESIGLALLHLPAPHAPSIYDRRTQTINATGRRSYLDGVVMADRILGELRQTMEQSGLWDRTAVLVSSDHGWRTSLWRGGPYWTSQDEAISHTDTSGIPFLVKLAGQTAGMVYDQPLNTLVTRSLITDILAGRLVDPAGIAGAVTRVLNRFGGSDGRGRVCNPIFNPLAF